MTGPARAKHVTVLSSGHSLMVYFYQVVLSKRLFTTFRYLSVLHRPRSLAITLPASHVYCVKTV